MEDRYRPTTPRQRRVILLVAVATVVTLWLLLLYRPGGHPRVYPPAPPASESAGCGSEGGVRCVGGQADVMLILASPQAPASSGAPAP